MVVRAACTWRGTTHIATWQVAEIALGDSLLYSSVMSTAALNAATALDALYSAVSLSKGRIS